MITLSEFKGQIDFEKEIKFGLTWKERWDKAEDSDLTFFGRLFTTISLIVLFYLPTTFIPPTYMNAETYNILVATGISAGFWLLTTIAFGVTLLVLAVLVPLIVWIIKGDYSSEYLFKPLQTFSEKFRITYKVVFGDYEHKWDDLYYHFHPGEKAKILLSQEK